MEPTTHRGRSVGGHEGDVELFRDLLLVLETYQTSPRAVVIISSELESETLGRPPVEIEEGLATLLDYEYIDGPGPDEPGFFLFRKLTRKGLEFIKASRHPRDWEQLKQHYAERLLDAP